MIVRDYSSVAEGHCSNDTIYALAPSCAVSRWYAADTAGHCCPFPAPPQLQALIRQADHDDRFLLHDRDSIFSQPLDQRIRHLGLRVLKTPPQSPQANALCERLLGTLWQECVDFVIPLAENHLRRLLSEWMQHYNHGRPHMALGPGIPQPLVALPAPLQEQRHRLPAHGRVVARPILGGLHHEYWLEEQAA